MRFQPTDPREIVTESIQYKIEVESSLIKAEHIFIHCPVAKHVWDFVNHNLHAEGIQRFEVSDLLIFFRHSLNKFEAYFVTELLWALWRVNNHNNYEISGDQTYLFWSHENALHLLKDRISFVSKIDRDLYADRVFLRKWKKIKDLFGFVFDNG